MVTIIALLSWVFWNHLSWCDYWKFSNSHLQKGHKATDTECQQIALFAGDDMDALFIPSGFRFTRLMLPTSFGSHHTATSYDFGTPQTKVLSYGRDPLYSSHLVQLSLCAPPSCHLQPQQMSESQPSLPYTAGSSASVHLQPLWS